MFKTFNFFFFFNNNPSSHVISENLLKIEVAGFCPATNKSLRTVANCVAKREIANWDQFFKSCLLHGEGNNIATG